MAVIETKFSVGDVVYHAATTTERKQHPCPDCLGSRKWSLRSPAGTDYEIGCPRCAARFMNDRDLSLDYTAHVPYAKRLTIGSVQYNSHAGAFDHGARYMCVETGVGGGSVYDEARLFETEADALISAKLMADKANCETEWVVKLYDKSLEISDYQLDNAALKLAADAKSWARSMLWNLSDLFGRIGEADDKDAILEAVEDYKNYDWARDKEAVARTGGAA